MAAGITENGDIKFADGIIGPKDLFTSNNRTGKRVATDAELTFNKVGDTYTLTGVSGNMGGASISLDNLDKFTHRGDTIIFGPTTSGRWTAPILKYRISATQATVTRSSMVMSCMAKRNGNLSSYITGPSLHPTTVRTTTATSA